MGWKCETGWEERIMFGTDILACPKLAAPNFWCPIESHWGYVLQHLFTLPDGIEKSAADALCKL
jgi:hypothetical protein